VWAQLAEQGPFGQPVGYVTADKLSLTQDGKAVSWTALPACPTPPPPPGEAVSAIPPGADKPTNVCQRNILGKGGVRHRTAGEREHPERLDRLALHREGERHRRHHAPPHRHRRGRRGRPHQGGR
jgi:hypothetical protein